MTNDTFETSFADWQKRADFLNQKLMPITNRPVDINAHDWVEKLEKRPHPADESGLRTEIETLFNEVIDQFELYGPDQRQQIIDLMYQNDALMYARCIDADRNTPGGFRKHMILFVIDDQGKDTRDAMLALGAHHADAKRLGIDVGSIFKEMAAISSTREKFGWGSTRDLFHKYLK